MAAAAPAAAPEPQGVYSAVILAPLTEEHLKSLTADRGAGMLRARMSPALNGMGAMLQHQNRVDGAWAYYLLTTRVKKTKKAGKDSPENKFFSSHGITFTNSAGGKSFAKLQGEWAAMTVDQLPARLTALLHSPAAKAAGLEVLSYGAELPPWDEEMAPPQPAWVEAMAARGVTYDDEELTGVVKTLLTGGIYGADTALNASLGHTGTVVLLREVWVPTAPRIRLVYKGADPALEALPVVLSTLGREVVAYGAVEPGVYNGVAWRSGAQLREDLCNPATVTDLWLCVDNSWRSEKLFCDDALRLVVDTPSPKPANAALFRLFLERDPFRERVIRAFDFGRTSLKLRECLTAPAAAEALGMDVRAFMDGMRDSMGALNVGFTEHGNVLPAYRQDGTAYFYQFMRPAAAQPYDPADTLAAISWHRRNILTAPLFLETQRNSVLEADGRLKDSLTCLRKEQQQLHAMLAERCKAKVAAAKKAMRTVPGEKITLPDATLQRLEEEARLEVRAKNPRDPDLYLQRYEQQLAEALQIDTAGFRGYFAAIEGGAGELAAAAAAEAHRQEAAKLKAAYQTSDMRREDQLEIVYYFSNLHDKLPPPRPVLLTYLAEKLDYAGHRGLSLVDVERLYRDKRTCGRARDDAERMYEQMLRELKLFSAQQDAAKAEAEARHAAAQQAHDIYFANALGLYDQEHDEEALPPPSRPSPGSSYYDIFKGPDAEELEGLTDEEALLLRAKHIMAKLPGHMGFDALYLNRMMLDAAEHGYMTVLEWAVGEGFESADFTRVTMPLPETELCTRAAAANKVAVLEWAKAAGFPYDRTTAQTALTHGADEALLWLRDNGCPTA